MADQVQPSSIKDSTRYFAISAKNFCRICDYIDTSGSINCFCKSSMTKCGGTNPSKLQECDWLENRTSASCYWDFVSLFAISKWRWNADRQRREGGTKLAYSSINTMPLFYFLPWAVFSMPVQRAQSVKNHHCGTMHTGRQQHRANFQRLPTRPDGQSLGLWAKDLCHVFS